MRRKLPLTKRCNLATRFRISNFISKKNILRKSKINFYKFLDASSLFSELLGVFLTRQEKKVDASIEFVDASRNLKGRKFWKHCSKGRIKLPHWLPLLADDDSFILSSKKRVPSPTGTYLMVTLRLHSFCCFKPNKPGNCSIS
jgi:hypothetical protein